MIEIKLEQIQEIFRYYGINDEIESFVVLSNIEEWRKNKAAVRKIVQVNLNDGSKRIVKFLNERSFIIDVSKLTISTEIIEQQSRFSELLRNHGMIVPKKYNVNGKFCMPYTLSGIPVDVTVEDYLGEEIKVFDPKFFGEYGKLIGQMHQISMTHDAHIGFSIVYNEVKENRTDFMKLFTGTDISKLPKNVMDEIVLQHNEKKDRIIQIWTLLPKGAVQGDIYSCNNVAMTEKGIGFYDFNIAADEVLMGDMLHVWFRTIYDISNENDIKTWNLKECFKSYMEGYQSYRLWTDIEKVHFSEVYALLGSIYAGRYVAELMRNNRYEDAIRHLEDIKIVLNIDLSDLKLEDK